VKLAPHYTRAWLNLAMAQEQLGCPDKALRSCRRVAKLEPNNSLAIETINRLAPVKKAKKPGKN
jgi:Tfp pilus assembly protein PilF